ncbi:TKL protein kinase [Saprolegnia diclina VS20]|uniref:TKL protein kinase n=1 Tax=Saprolegnia diclina (strain VS20) TaxID=1156394 RepID=T0PNZ6_SAPDV|nr:TKL protein kinase [Saprolegnia diclina VS20]EQC27154.1 TKL protein kinase [Saprolegnia diclina VS20]|eukprot:XP_008619440.1 TKL protein kinase [Saprolegnia diclina VS20]
MDDTLLYAARDKQARWLKRGGKINSTDKDGRTLLYKAAQKGLYDTAKFLLENKANVHQAKSDGSTPLHVACREGHVKIVELLLKYKADTSVAMNEGTVPLYAASRNGHRAVVKALLAAKADVNHVVIGGKTAMQVASRNGHRQVVELLLRAGARVDEPLTREYSYEGRTVPTGSTSLSVAIMFGHSDIVALLGRPPSVPTPAPARPCPPLPSATAQRTSMSHGLVHDAVRGGVTQDLNKALRAPDVDLTARNANNETALILAIKLHHRHFPQLIYHAMHHPGIVEVPEHEIEVDYQRRLGCGGTGYINRGLFRGKRVAVKQGRPSGAQSLRREIRAMETCNSPYLLELIAVSGWSTQHPKLVLEYMDSGNLREYLDKKRDGESVSIEYQPEDVAWVMASALADLHRNGFVHRDLKSLNVLLSSESYIKVADFGLTREFEENMTTEVGTPAWIAPEVLMSGGTYDAAADVYSFGVVLIELVTLRVPYAGLSRYQIAPGVLNGTLRPNDNLSIFADVPEWLTQLIDDCVAFDPTRRPTANAILDRLALHGAVDATSPHVVDRMMPTMT